MKHFENYHTVIATKERSAGNDTVGDSWIETKSFSKTTPISEIIEWASNASWKLIITIDESSSLE
jgi:hypothetical protein